jgi:hydrogenase/urease accessory protein HupE
VTLISNFRAATCLFVLLLWAGSIQLASAHTIRPSVATVTVAADGNIDVRIRANVEAMLADIGPEYTNTNDSPNAAAYDRLRSLGPDEIAAEFKSFLPRFPADTLLIADNNKPVALEYSAIEVPATGDIELTRDSTLVLQGTLPAGVTELYWAWPPEYGSSVVRFSGPDSGSPQSEWLQTGQRSDSYAVSGTAEEFGTGRVIRDYLVIGFEHIVPKGLDHILFVVGIFLLSIRLKPLLLQVTAFTLAHTITLGLSIYGVISVPPSIVEPLIALSIAYVGIENCFSAKLQPWRLALVFSFGLLHGLGFAGVLSEIGLPRSEFMTALISFNVGVEFGQLTVICGCLLLFGWCSKRDWYRSVVVIPLSAIIAAVALYWTWERIFG